MDGALKVGSGAGGLSPELILSRIEDVVKVGALATALALFASPMMEMKAARKLGRIADQVSVVPFVSMAMNAANWFCYGVFTGDLFPTALTNGLGLACALYYNFVYLSVASPSKRIEAKKLVLLATAFVAGVVAYCRFSDPSKEALVASHVATVASTTTIILYGSPLVSIKAVLDTRSTAALSLPLTVTSTLCSVFWFSYGRLRHNPFMWIPNGLGVLLSTAQISLFMLFPRGGKSGGKKPSGNFLASPRPKASWV